MMSVIGRRAGSSARTRGKTRADGRFGVQGNDVEAPERLARLATRELPVTTEPIACTDPSGRRSANPGRDGADRRPSSSARGTPARPTLALRFGDARIGDPLGRALAGALLNTPPDLRDAVHEPFEIVGLQHEQSRFLAGADRGGPRLLVEDRDLAEELPRAEAGVVPVL